MYETMISEFTKIEEVFETIDNCPLELKASIYELLVDMTRKLYDRKKFIEMKIISEMQKENATKEIFISRDGSKKTIILKTETPKPDKTLLSKWTDSGFNISDLGEFEFRPSWSKAKEQRKFGGDKQKIIDEIFVGNVKKLIIQEEKK